MCYYHIIIIYTYIEREMYIYIYIYIWLGDEVEQNVASGFDAPQSAVRRETILYNVL